MLTDGARAAGGVHPMMRLIADAAPQQGEVAMRSGLPQEVSLYRALIFPGVVLQRVRRCGVL